MCDSSNNCYSERFWLIGITGSLLAVFGVVSNALLTVVFLSDFTYRHSPCFFLGFVALYDTLLDFTYIVLLSVPICAGFTTNISLCLLWHRYSQPFQLFAQIFKISSVFCLIAASIERYLMTRHWTFTGFEHRTRWFILIIIVVFAVIIKTATCSFGDASLSTISRCEPVNERDISKSNKDFILAITILNIATLFFPFITLVFLNGAIVFMLKKRNIQQLRMLITELTMGKDIMKVRKKNLRSATHTLIVIITAYLLSNLLSLIITSVDFVFPGVLQNEHSRLHLISTDVAQVLTVMGNAIRCPAHLFSSSDVRHHFKIMLLGEEHKVKVQPTERKASQKVEAPWLSLLIIPDENQFSFDTGSRMGLIRRFSANVLLPCSRRPSLSSPVENRRNTYCYGNNLTAVNCNNNGSSLYADDSVEILL